MTLENIGGRTEEEIEDIVGAMAEAGYGLEYDDAEGLIAATRRGPNPYDAAQSFTESDVSVTHSGTRTESGSVALIDESDNQTTTRSDDTDSFTQATKKKGVVFTPKMDIDGVTATLSSNTSGVTSYYLIRLSDGQTLDTSSFAGDTFTATAPLNGGTKYAITCDAGGGEYTTGYPSANYPYTGLIMDMTGGYNSGDTADYLDPYSIKSIEPETNISAKSGSATIEWSYPTDIYEWDVATFTKTLDGENVDVFVAVDDGSGWTRANGGAPISRNYSLADDPDISPDDEIRIEAELSRSDVGNNPTLDSAYRSWVV